MKNQWKLRILSIVMLFAMIGSAGITVGQMPDPVQAQVNNVRHHLEAHSLQVDNVNLDKTHLVAPRVWVDQDFNPGANNNVDSITVQPDGKILVGGYFTELGGQPRQHIARLNPDGSLDAAFNPGANSAVLALALQPDGKILVGGWFTELGGQPRFRIGRLHPDGSLDEGFNPGVNNQYINGTVYTIALQPDGKILVGGWFIELGGAPRQHIARLHPDGSLDQDFDPKLNGIVNTIALQPDGKILVGGRFTSLNGETRERIARFNLNGTLDTIFNPGANECVFTLALQPDGSILVGGMFTSLNGETRERIARLHNNGELDEGFNPGAFGTVSSIAVQPDGKILVGGGFLNLGGEARYGIARLNPDGSLDAAFNPGANSAVLALALQPDGKILVGGWFTELGEVARHKIGRLHAELPANVYVNISEDTRFSPGERATYAINYYNSLEDPIRDALLVVRLPHRAAYEESSTGGIHWHQRNEVFWNLGDLAPGASGRVFVTVTYDWGIPEGDGDSLFAVLMGSNYNTEFNDLESYLEYEPLVVTSAEGISISEWEGELAGIPEMGALYTQALDAGYLFATAERVNLSDGTTSLRAVLIEQEQRVFRFLYFSGEQPLAATFTATFTTIEDTTGGLIWDAETEEITFWGAWDLEAGTEALYNSYVRGGGIACCLNNCLANSAVSFIMSKISTILSNAISAVGCRNAFRDGDPIQMAKCANDTLTKIPYLGEALDLAKCLEECSADPNSHDCTHDKRECVAAKWPFTQFGSTQAVEITECRDGCYLPAKKYIHCGAQQCCHGGKCYECGGGSGRFSVPDSMANGCNLASRSGAAGGCDCQENECDPAEDPNEKYGPAGHLLPGELVTYTIEYENVGAGEAYGVYILDELDEAFDESTLDIGPNATFSPTTRIIDWDIGTVAPAGEPGSTGEVTFSVRLKDDLPGGTIVINQAVIYFPSVPQEEPTSTIVNIIQPVVAETQSLTTTFDTPIAVTLSGREVTDAALTYRIVENPSFGTLEGEIPNLIYTPMEDFAGEDRFTFVVNNGVMDSSPAPVYITVTLTEGLNQIFLPMLIR